MRFRNVVLALGFAAGALTAGANAQARRPLQPNGDERELFDFVLTMAKVQRLSGAAKGLHELEKRHPKMGSESPDNRNINEMVKNIEKYPDAVSVLSRNGLTPREYAVGFVTLIQSSMAVGLKKAGTFKELPPELAKMVSKANLAFVEQHYAEIQKLMPDWSSDDRD